MTMRRSWAVLFAVLALSAGGCASAYQKGVAALRQERYTDAATHFEEALQERPERVDALVGLGIARYEAGAYDDAAATLSRAASREPKRPEAQLYLGLAELQRGDEGAAEEHLRAFREVTKSARLARQADDALALMRTQGPLSPETRRFIAGSLESTARSEQELRDARRAYRPYFADPFFYDPFFGSYVSAFAGPRCFVTRHRRLACF